jgi:hypothetical protein
MSFPSWLSAVPTSILTHAIEACVPQSRLVYARRSMCRSIDGYCNASIIGEYVRVHSVYVLQVLAARSSHVGALQEMITECYTNGTYSKVPEFLEFWRRGRDSITYLEIQTESCLLYSRMATQDCLITTGKLAKAAEGIKRAMQEQISELDDDDPMMPPGSELYTNDDLGHRPRWLPPHGGLRCEPAS